MAVQRLFPSGTERGGDPDGNLPQPDRRAAAFPACIRAALGEGSGSYRP